jgi:RimJ/RimL family protein N-acetyltransferase
MKINNHLRLLVTELDNNDKPEILAHLLRLSPNDRYLRFFAALGDFALNKYVNETVDLSASKAYGIFDEDRKTLIAFAHVAGIEQGGSGLSAELGISVDSSFRGFGLARRLMDRTLVFCKSHDIGMLYMSCLRENKAMQHLAKTSGLQVIIDHGDAIAKLQLAEWPLDKAACISHDLAYQQIAIVDKCYRRNTELVNALLKGL